MEATDPSTLQWIALILMGVLFVGASSQLRNLWRGTTRGLREPELSQWWPFGSILGSAFVRTMHLAVLLGGGIVFLVFSDILQDHFPGEAWRVSRVTVAFMILVLASLWVSVAAFNRPRWVVPPYLRDQPGALSALWQRLKARNED